MEPPDERKESPDRASKPMRMGKLSRLFRVEVFRYCPAPMGWVAWPAAMNEMRPRLPSTVPPEEPSPVVSPGPPSPSLIFFALGNQERYAMMKLMADGQPRKVREIAGAVRRKFNGVSKHLAILRSAGLLESCTPEGADGRTSWYQLPAAFRATPGVLDFGCCVVRL